MATGGNWRRWLGVGGALTAAALAALSVQAGVWWRAEAGVVIGPLGSRHCFGGTCRRVPSTWFASDDRWHTLGSVTYAAALVLAGLLVFAAGALAAGRQPRYIAQSAAVAAVLSLIAGVAFFFSAPSLPSGSPAWGAPALVAAVVMTVVAFRFSAKT